MLLIRWFVTTTAGWSWIILLRRRRDADPANVGVQRTGLSRIQVQFDLFSTQGVEFNLTTFLVSGLNYYTGLGLANPVWPKHLGVNLPLVPSRSTLLFLIRRSNNVRYLGGNIPPSFRIGLSPSRTSRKLLA